MIDTWLWSSDVANDDSDIDKDDIASEPDGSFPTSRPVRPALKREKRVAILVIFKCTLVLLVIVVDIVLVVVIETEPRCRISQSA